MYNPTKVGTCPVPHPRITFSKARNAESTEWQGEDLEQSSAKLQTSKAEASLAHLNVTGGLPGENPKRQKIPKGKSPF
jgi:hypothetical protein